MAQDLFYSRQFDDVKRLFENNKDRPGIAWRLAAVAAYKGPDAAKEEFESWQSGDNRESTFARAGQYLLRLREYAAAAGLLRESMKELNESRQTDLDMLARTVPAMKARYSSDPPIALAQHAICALFDPWDEEGWKKLYVPEWRDLRLYQERNELWGMLRAWHSLASQQLSTGQVADVVVSTGTFVKDGTDATGFRVRIADPASNGAMKTLFWVVKRGGDYQILGAGPGWATLGGEGLAAAARGDLKAAKQWLDWQREDLQPPSGKDPLATPAFTRLWPTPNAGAQETMAAAASLAARGGHFEIGLATLRDLQKAAAPGGWRENIDLAIAQCLALHGRHAEAVPEATHLYAAFPDSDAAFSQLIATLIAAERFNDAERTIGALLTKQADSAVAVREQASLLAARHSYRESVAVLEGLSGTSKVTAQDWNQIAWTALFAGESKLEAAKTTVRLTQNRNLASLHTLGCVEAAVGDTAAARRILFQYIDAHGTFDDSGRLLLGLLAERLGLPDVAREDYGGLEQPKEPAALSSWALAQIQLGAMKAASAERRAPQEP